MCYLYTNLLGKRCGYNFAYHIAKVVDSLSPKSKSCLRIMQLNCL
ncbi:unnamed protein product [Amoebophrya sp. A25]|nr:unnamed protein product [Amoebophrya sp. A25]|eukprot:GSA25T00028050001.1